MSVFQRWSRKLGDAMGVVGWAGAVMSSVLLMAMVALIMGEIVMRGLFSSSLNITTEFVGYGVAAITFNGLAHAFQMGALIRVGLIGGLVARHPRLDPVLQGLALVLTLAGTAVATFYFASGVLRHYERGAVSETAAGVPLWVPEGLALLGMAMFCLQLVSALANLLSGNRDLAGDRLAEPEDVGAAAKAGG